MKARAVAVMGLAIAMSWAAATGYAQAPSLELPAYQTHTLDNGLTLLVMEHGSVPLVSFRMWIDAGGVCDPASQDGLAALTAGCLRKGSGGSSALEFAEELGYLGASFDASADHDRSSIGLSCLAKDFDVGLQLFADAIVGPAFEADEVSKLAAQMTDDVKQAKDNPRYVMGEYQDAFLYGDHPYARPVDGTETSLGGLGAAEVKGFHADRYGADRAILAVVGDIDVDVVVGKIEAAFGGMATARAPRVDLPDPAPTIGRRVMLVDKSDTPQTWFRIGNMGPKEGDPDYAPVELVRTIFGGRFTSRLNTSLRIESGLTYGAGYRIARRRVAGPAYISSFTAKETTQEAIDLALKELDRLHADGLTEAELASAKAYVKGQTPYDFETGGSLASTLCHITYYGLGREHVDGLFPAIDAVTLGDCRRVIAEWFPHENLIFTTVGVAAEVEEVLAGYGELTLRPNGSPGFAPIDVTN